MRTRHQRKKDLYLRNYCGGIGHDAWIRELPCEVAGCPNRTEAAHVTARGMGGCNSSWRSLVPLCRIHHLELDVELGRDGFLDKYGVDLAERAAFLATMHLEEEGIFDA